jgi:hypothetical protein
VAVAYRFLVRRMQRYRFSFRSPEAQDISAHLTPFERDAFVANARAYGRRLGGRLSLLMIPCIIAGFYSLWLGAAVFALGTLLLLPLVRSQCQRMRELLSATEWARARGISSETLRLFSFRRFR